MKREYMKKSIKNNSSSDVRSDHYSIGLLTEQHARGKHNDRCTDNNDNSLRQAMSWE